MLCHFELKAFISEIGSFQEKRLKISIKEKWDDTFYIILVEPIEKLIRIVEQLKNIPKDEFLLFDTWFCLLRTLLVDVL